MTRVKPDSAETVTIVLDYDGTITEKDLLQQVAMEFGDTEVVANLDRRLGEGGISLREEITGEYATVRVPLSDVLDWVFERVRIRPGFRELLELARERGWRVIVVSSGFHELIEPVFEREGIEVELYANRVDPKPEGWIVEWRYEDRCDVCGQSCKRSVVARLTGGEEIVYIGDGYSDRCAAEAADRAFAVKGLARYLERKGVPFEPFSDFFDVARSLES